MSALVKRYFPILLLASLAFFIVGDTLLLDPTLNNYAASVRAAQGIIGSFAVILSVTLMSRLHVRRIQRRTRTIESSVLLICMWATISWGLFRLFVKWSKSHGRTYHNQHIQCHRLTRRLDNIRHLGFLHSVCSLQSL